MRIRSRVAVPDALQTKGLNLSFSNKRSFLQHIDSLPQGVAWIHHSVTLEGDILGPDDKPLKEELELWARDPVAVIKDLLSNPSFAGNIDFEPVRVWLDEQGKTRCISETNTADWMWELQVRGILIAYNYTLTMRSSGSHMVLS